MTGVQTCALPICTAIEQISELLSELRQSRLQINDTLKMLHAKYPKIEIKTFRRVALIYHKQNASQVQTEASEVNELYKAITS